jgi:hypothetical protein
LPYTLNEFAADCHAALSDDPDIDGRQKVRKHLCQLLMEDPFVDAHCGPEVKPGTSLLYEDDTLGFQVVAQIMGDAYNGEPHDHGASWAIYGQAVGYTDMTEWARLDDGSVEGIAKIEKTNGVMLASLTISRSTQSAIHPVLGSFESPASIYRPSPVRASTPTMIQSP